MTTPLLVLVGGVVFAVGFALGSVVFSLVRRQQERSLLIKAKAIEAARRYLLRYDIHLPAWVIAVTHQDREIRVIKQRGRRSGR